MANSVRVNLTVSVDLLKRVDAYADSLGISRSAAFSVLASSWLNSLEATTALAKLVVDGDEQPG